MQKERKCPCEKELFFLERFVHMMYTWCFDTGMDDEIFLNC